MSETTETKKTDLKLFGEIDKRFSQLTESGKEVLRRALENALNDADVAIIKQIVERHAELSDDGRKYADAQIGVNTAAE